MHDEAAGIPRWAMAGFGVLILALGLVLGVWLRARFAESDEVKSVAAAPQTKPRAEPRTPPIREARTRAKEMPPASAGVNRPVHQNHRTAPSSPGNSAATTSSFASLEASLGATVGLVVAPLTPGQAPQVYGQLQVGHAWSSMKVPIVATLMRNGEFSSEDEGLARSAITASDNEAAAALFSQLESSHGGLTGASGSLQETLAAAGDTTTQIATAPPPPGAVSTWGQTEWSLSGSVAFYRALACGELVEPGSSELVLGMMEEVISEQQWGLGQASFPAGTRVAFKAGWGPEVEAGGAYLVRQAGVIRTGSSGMVVTLAAEDASGSFEAGVGDIDALADWLAENVGSLPSGSC
jgi:hypothetical protein